MTRNATEAQTFLIWQDEVPYLVTWTPGQTIGTLTARVADTDYGHLAAAAWSTTIRMEAAAAALDQIAAVNVQMHHDADQAARLCDDLAKAA